MDGFDYWQLLQKFRYPLLFLLLGLILMLSGLFIYKSGIFAPLTKVEVLESPTESQGSISITAEISGAVINPGVYKLMQSARIEDLIVTAGGLSATADRSWTDKYLNRAAKISDGQKVYIPAVNEQSNTLSAKTTSGVQTISTQKLSDSSSLININSASLEELDSLPGIGQVYGQSIIEHRPYSNTSELVSKGAIKQNIFEKIKDKISVY